MNGELAISVDHISKKYELYDDPKDRLKETLSITHKIYHRDFYALQDISFDVKKGETVGIVGTNGSGKSTILKIITGVLAPSNGTVAVNGRISALLELGAGFNMEFTGLQNIYLNGKIMNMTKKQVEEAIPEILDFAEIGEFIYQPVKTYSSGMFARLAFAVAINVRPDILIVDEALSVGDMFFQNKCYRKFEELKEQGVTILFVSHDIASVRQMCSRVVWIEKGKQIIFDQADKVCDLYMDMKRKNAAQYVNDMADEKLDHIEIKDQGYNMPVPRMMKYNSELESDALEIKACFFENMQGEIVSHIEADRKYRAHVMVEFHQDIDNIIVGFILENAKGLPLYDMNNYISCQKLIEGRQGKVVDVVFAFTLPLLMRGMYIVSAAVAQGTQTCNRQLVWLHGVGNVEIINNGFNSSYIEIHGKVDVYESDASDFQYI